MTLDDLPSLRAEVAGLQGGERTSGAKKSLGQNFLFDLNLTRKIARAALPLDQGTVVEIGPGPGGLTRALLLEGASKVVAVERDERMRPILERLADASDGRLTVVFGDALETDLASLVDGPAQIVANLPYNVGTPLLVNWLLTDPWPPWFSGLTLMFQKEVAQRITATPGDGAYGRLGVLAGWRCQASRLFDIPPSAFVPPPKVTSSVVQLLPRATPLSCQAGRSGAGGGGGLRPAAQDAAAIAEGVGAGCRGAGGAFGQRGAARHGAGRDAVDRPVHRPGADLSVARAIAYPPPSIRSPTRSSRPGWRDRRTVSAT